MLHALLPALLMALTVQVGLDGEAVGCKEVWL